MHCGQKVTRLFDIETLAGLISSAGAANVADGFLNNSSCFPQYFHG